MALLHDKDEVLSVAAACALTDLGYVPPTVLARLEQLAGYQAVRTKAFDFFMKKHEYGLAEALCNVPARPQDDVVGAGMRAHLASDYAALAQTEVQKFLNTGAIEHLHQAIGNAEFDGGWRSALPLLVKAILINPKDARWPKPALPNHSGCQPVRSCNQFCDIVDTIRIFPTVSAMFRLRSPVKMARRKRD